MYRNLRYQLGSIVIQLSHQYLTIVQCWNIQFGCETINLAKKVYFNEFVAKALHDNMGMIIFDLQGCGGCWRPKTSYLRSHFGAFTHHLLHPTAPVLVTKDSSRNEIRSDSQPPLSLHNYL